MEEKIPFWLDDFSILYNNDNYLKFYPSRESSRNEQLNSITRFFLYLIIIFYSLNLKEEYIYVPFSFIVATSLLYCSYSNDKKGKIRDKINRNKVKNINKKKKTKTNTNKNKLINYTNEKQKNLQEKSEDIKKNIVLETNINPSPVNMNNFKENEIDSNNDYLITKNILKDDDIIENMTNNLNEDIKKQFELEIDNYNFVKPTINNPFMNPTLYKNENNIEMINDIDIQNEINKNFNHNLFLDIEDAYKNRNSQRQFYTIPGSRLPPDQMKFARWLYNDDTSCKLNTKDCLPYPRYKRVRIGNQL